MRKQREDAVSPVVGVMLMLVVTIIIAAVVSTFAGGLGGGQEKLQQVQIRATYSQADGMAIEHLGGDAIATISTNVIVRPSKTFGNAEHMRWIVNKTSIIDKNDENGVPWVKGTGVTGTKAFRPGETHYILPPNHNATFLQPGASKTYQFDNPDNIGRTFFVEFVDDTGRVFARTEGVIKP
ncbi:type IV pilin N-terminal domain-containing protein [Methanoculleus sp. 7T]|uniref:type IV pilin N-terminal domain-containing protein n=1 Tax=Methanoculleus sp. 7T TaxID=2937282 RepID=UPI0020BF54C6|nr:type IV pilin N-terminal domain-containing protein [Methanoculleus sp. 7T]MCK8517821.1 type IV pilin N-terminal domain-containing protein [Methanoculleus sp. 7T]